MIGDEKTFFSHKCPPSKAQSILPGIPPTKPPSARNRWLNHLFPTNYMNKPRHSKAPPANPDPHLHCGIRGTSLSGSSETSRKIERTAFHCDILTSTCSLGVRDHTLHSRFVNQTGKVAHETQHALDNLSHEAIHMYKFLMFYLCNHHPAQNQRKLALFAKLLVN